MTVQEERVSTEKKLPNRWAIAVAGVVMQLCLGTVYAWSVFNVPLETAWGWTRTQTSMVFTIVVVCLAGFAVVGGYILDAKGPKIVAIMSGILFPVGLFIAAFGALNASLPVIWLGYGLIGGIGLGFGYITPVATLVKWFPDKRGLITGIAVLGFGLGSGFMSIIAPRMINVVSPEVAAASSSIFMTYEGNASGVFWTLIIFGSIFLVLGLLSAMFMQNPPPGYVPEGWTPKAGAKAAEGTTLGEAVRTLGFYLCWLMLCINVMAGMSVISQAMPMTQSFIENNAVTQPFRPETAALAGVLVLAFAISNGVFRPFWALLSDKIGRAQVFLILFATQAITFLILGFAPPNLPLFIILIFYQYSCLGGGFATMPAMAADKFGTKYAGRIYGWMLTAWGVAGLIGPTMYAQIVNSHPGGVGVPQAYTPALVITGIIFAVACILPLVEINLSKKALATK